MKTAISIPDETFADAERHASRLGVSRSEFFTTAARRYMRELDATSLTQRINEAIDLVGDDEETTGLVAAAGLRAITLAEGEDW